MSTHTPGPWRIGNHSSEVIADMPANPPFRGMTDDCVKHYGGYLVAESCGAADARLIAAAPELLKALERIAREHDCGCVPCVGSCRSKEALEITVEEIQEIARSAIAKARGES